jgi:hypothetical protein
VEGTGNRSLTLMKPLPVTLERGGTSEATLRITRTNVKGAVEVEVENLPNGVTVAGEEQQTEGDDITVILEASEDADLVSNHMAKVTIEGPEGLKASEPLEVTVRATGS